MSVLQQSVKTRTMTLLIVDTHPPSWLRTVTVPLPNSGHFFCSVARRSYAVPQRCGVDFCLDITSFVVLCTTITTVFTISITNKEDSPYEYYIIYSLLAPSLCNQHSSFQFSIQTLLRVHFKLSLSTHLLIFIQPLIYSQKYIYIYHKTKE